MAITVTGYPLGWLQVLGDAAASPIDLEGNSNLKMALVASGYTPNRDTHDFRNDFTANEVANGNGYTTGGVALTSVTFSYDSGTQQIRLDFADPSWTFTADTSWRYAIVYVDTGGADSTDPLLLLLDWGSTQTLQGVYTLTLDAVGIYAFDLT